MANLPKEYRVCAKKFNLNRKVPRLSIDDFLDLSVKALKACKRVTVKAVLTDKQHKELAWQSKEYNFKVSIDPLTVGVSVNVKNDFSLVKALDSHTVLDTDNASEGIDATFEELSKSRAFPERSYVVKVHGKPKPKPKEEKDYIVMTPMGPVPASSLGLVRRHEPIFVTLNVMSLSGHGPLIQDAYYDRLSLAEALAAKLPWQASVRDRNAFKYHICREMSDEEVTNLAVDTMAQYELVKGYTVKK